MTNQPEIKPIIANNPKDRYLADMVDFRYYSNVNNGFGWMLVYVDSFSKYCSALPCKSKSATDVRDAFRHMFSFIGPPAIFYTDNGKEVGNSLMEDFNENLDIKMVHGRARCPWS
jgi:transposase InsO family protein